MINIVIYKKHDLVLGFEIKGHANYAEYGNDIVCAAVSVLSQTTLFSFIDVCKLNKDEYYYKLQDDGYLLVRLNSKYIRNKQFLESQIVLKTFEVGIKSISESYSEHVALEYREV